ncbi:MULTISPECIES: acyltransferase [unclassified Shewanella]|uniref:acyltransferase n=1 Tax=unclassified Shewanella TaxID=196818 RepID=UPI0021DA7712|nr:MULTISPECIES: acyltransferase [unclassified Shewanella]MCU8034065.1 acyltransferase [Shewanella sp. SM71]MCU8095974.1 acyltransferase [Shewanella sp. SM102]
MFELFEKGCRRFQIAIWIILNCYRFKHLGIRSYVYSSTRISGHANISIGSRTGISEFAWLMVDTSVNKSPQLIVGDDVYIGRLLHLVCFDEIIIGNSVLIADKVYISDNLHDYNDISKPIKEQPIIVKNKVKIGSGSWIGENVSIIGANVGKNSVIAAHSVVTKDIPDYCVAAGIPAKIIKRYDFDRAEWIKVD